MFEQGQNRLPRSRPPPDDTILISSDDSNDSNDSSIQVIHFKCFQVNVIEIFTRDFTFIQ